MNRSLLLGGLGLLLHALGAGVAVAFGWSGIPMAPAVVLVAYAALAEPPVEAAISATLLGLILDALSGSPLGLNMLACLLALLVGRLAAGWVSSARGLQVFLFAATLSGGYHLFLLTLLTLFGDGTGSRGLAPVLSTAIWDGALAIVLVPAVQRLFIRFRLEEREVSLSERLTRRAQGRR